MVAIFAILFVIIFIPIITVSQVVSISKMNITWLPSYLAIVLKIILIILACAILALSAIGAITLALCFGYKK